jgi:hypothetical protein
MKEAPALPIRARYLLKADAKGFVRLGDIERRDFGNRQAKNVASLLDGTEGINLGEELKYQGESGNYSDMKIHIDDIEVFVERIKNYYEPKNN